MYVFSLPSDRGKHEEKYFGFNSPSIPANAKSFPLSFEPLTLRAFGGITELEGIFLTRKEEQSHLSFAREGIKELYPNTVFSD